MMRLWVVALFAASACPWAAQAQAIKAEPPLRHFEAGEIAEIQVPAINTKETAGTADDFEKNFYFHRENTSFDEAYADIKECDAFAQGIRYFVGGNGNNGYLVSQYGMGGAIGDALGNALADAIFGASERRKIRRFNVRNCMAFKEYQRYGLDEKSWDAISFTEGDGRKKSDVHETSILIQAKLASGLKPVAKVLQP